MRRKQLKSIKPNNNRQSLLYSIFNQNMKGLLQQIRFVDEKLSNWVFQMALPWHLEFLLSIPGNSVGPPLFQVVASLWLCVLMSKKGVKAELIGTAIGFTTILVLLGCLFLRGNRFILSKILFSHVSFALGPALTTALCYVLAPSPKAFSISIHPVILYTVSCIPIMFLKHWTLRKRPCCVCSPSVIERKHLSVIPRILIQIAPDASFPSGDVMSAVAVALPLSHAGYPMAAVTLVLLTAFGRVFFLAHHWSDTIVGGGICLLLHHSLAHPWIGLSIGNAEWYHPLLALVSLALASLFRRSNQK